MQKHDIEYLKDVIKIEALRKRARVSRRTIERVFFMGTAKSPVMNLRLARELRLILLAIDKVRTRLQAEFRDVPEKERLLFVNNTRPIVRDIGKLIDRLEESAKFKEE